jgi:hypothetical protein
MPIPAAHWHQRLANGLAHDLGLVVAKAVHGQLEAGVPQAEIVRQVALFGAQIATAGAWVLRSLLHHYRSDFGRGIWIPLLPSTSCVTRKLPAREHNM